MDWTPIAPVVGAVFLGAFRLAAFWLRLRAIMAASPEQLAAINKVEVPAFIRSSGPALALLAFSGALAAVPHIKEYRTQRALESARSRALTLSAPKIGDFAVDSRALGLPVYEGNNVQK